MAEQGTRNVLSIRGMCKSFGRNRVLDHIDLDVKEGSIMGLMGENGAGKSTMMKCLFGTYQKDEGTVFLNGKEVNFSSPKESLENGIAMVHQELNQCLERNVLDNLFLGRYPLKRTGTVDENRMKTEAAELFRKLNMTVNLTAPMKTMSVSARQMVEIAKAISYNARLIVLDEPTSSLTVKEVTKLFEMMRNLKAQGISLVYISHKMDEIFEICDEVSVMRDGKMVLTKETKETSMNELIAAMVGRTLDNRFPPVDNEPGDVVLNVEHLSTKFEPNLKDITFDVKEGDVVGIIGKNGAGKSTLLKLLSRVTSPTTGIIRAKGRIASLLEVGTGFHGEMTGRENIYMNGSILGMTRSEINRKLDDIIDFAGIERYIDTPVKRYSSGMTVRLGFAVAAFLDPEILVVDEVLAVGDAEFQRKAIGKMQDVSRGEGRTVLFVSHNMSAIRSLCHRGVVLDNGMVSFDGETEDAVQFYLKDAPVNDEAKSIKECISNKKSYLEIYDIQINMASLIEGRNKGYHFDVHPGEFVFRKRISLPRYLANGDYLVDLYFVQPMIQDYFFAPSCLTLHVEGFYDQFGDPLNLSNEGFIGLESVEGFPGSVEYL